MEKGLVTVCMPVYNGSEYIRESIDSILSQSYKNLELLIIDDGSTDDSRSIVEAYSDPRIRLVINDCNKGLIYTRNLGIELARGSFIAFNDCDDISLPERLHTQLCYLEQHANVGLCGTCGYVIDETSNVIGDIKVVVGQSSYLKCLLLFSNIFINSSIVIRSELLQDNRYELPLAEDFDLTQRLVYGGVSVANLPYQLVKYRIHTDNISRNKEQLLKANELLILERQLYQLNYMPTARDLELQYCFLTNDFQTHKLRDLDDWLLKLYELNLKCRVYEDTVFLRTLFLQLYKYARFKKSKLLYLRICFSKISILQFKRAFQSCYPFMSGRTNQVNTER